MPYADFTGYASYATVEIKGKLGDGQTGRVRALACSSRMGRYAGHCKQWRGFCEACSAHVYSGL